MSIITIGIDLAKNVFAVHGVNEDGKAALVKPKVAREHLLALVAQLPPCLIGMEACSGAHHWARLFRQHGHTVKLMAPKFVTPYRMSGRRGKNDAADAAAICEAVSRPKMRFVPIKEEHQQIILCLHRTRQGFVEERTATYNRLRGLIAEFGIVLPQKVACLRREIGAHLEALPGYAKRCIGDLLAHADQLDARIGQLETMVMKFVESNPQFWDHSGDELVIRALIVTFPTSCICLEPTLLPSTGITRLPRYYEPLRHPKAPEPSLTSVRLAIPDHAKGFPALRALSLCACCRHYPGTATGGPASLIHPAVSAFPERVVGSACASSFSRLAQRSLTTRASPDSQVRVMFFSSSLFSSSDSCCAAGIVREGEGLRNYNRSCWAIRPDPDERRAPGPQSLAGNDLFPLS